LTAFSDFGLSPLLLKALAAEGYENPTPIQTQAIPVAMTGRDILGIAQTGTGKTAAFALPILHRLLEKPRVPSLKGCRTLILAPTRELASQIADSFKAYGRHTRLSIATVFGGVSIGKQERQLAPGVDILVATPGRLLDLIDRRSLSIRDIDILVLDEADQMLDLGFIHALRRIASLIPADRQSLFFSATMPKTISGLADSYLKDPVKVAVTPVATTAERVEQFVMMVPQARKQAVLHRVLETQKMERTLIFSRTKHGADRVVRHLQSAGHEAAAIHGNKSQVQRERALRGFRDGNCPILVATDIAARGIDIDDVTHVVNFDLPNIPESYVHRIGRTARAGREGIALSFCADDEKPYLRDIERLTRQRVFVLPIPDGVDFSIKGGKIPESELVEDDARDGGRRGDARRAPARRPDGRTDARPEGRGDQRGDQRNQGRPARGGERAQGGAAHAAGGHRGGYRDHAERENSHREVPARDGHREGNRDGFKGGFKPAGGRSEGGRGTGGTSQGGYRGGPRTEQRGDRPNRAPRAQGRRDRD
jgi:ATP-dependent RNA helicase RhlE